MIKRNLCQLIFNHDSHSVLFLKMISLNMFLDIHVNQLMGTYMYKVNTIFDNYFFLTNDSDRISTYFQSQDVQHRHK